MVTLAIKGALLVLPSPLAAKMLFQASNVGFKICALAENR
jgi:hypothetical protein